jgi:hypothetical protein
MLLVQQTRALRECVPGQVRRQEEGQGVKKLEAPMTIGSTALGWLGERT